MVIPTGGNITKGLPYLTITNLTARFSLPLFMDTVLTVKSFPPPLILR
jgi:hypothetical protein